MNKQFERVVFWCKSEPNEGVYDTFPVELGKDESNAEYWSTITKRDWVDGRWTNTEVQKGIRFEYENLFKDVTIQSLSYRGNGGRAYKVVIKHDDKQFLVDFREDGIMDVIKNTGIEAGGHLNGDFTFIKDGSQTKLVRIGSEMHERFVKVRKVQNTKPLKLSEMTPMHFYKKKNGDECLYLGEFYTPEITLNDEVSKRINGNSYSYGYNRRRGSIDIGNKVKKSHLFIELHVNEDWSYNQVKVYNNIINGESDKHDMYYVQTLSSSSFIEDLGQVAPFNTLSKEDIFKFYKNQCVKYLENFEGTHSTYSKEFSKFAKVLLGELNKEDVKVEEEDITLLKKYGVINVNNFVKSID